MQEWILGFAAITSLSAVGFVIVAIMWLWRLRESVSSALADSARQQIHTAEKLTETLEQVQKQQDEYEQQLLALAQANSQLRQGLVNVVTRLDHSFSDASPNDRTLH